MMGQITTRSILAPVFAIVVASAAQAESLCGVLDRSQVLGTIAGDWQLEGAVSAEGETLSQVRQTLGHVIIDATGRIATAVAPAGEEAPRAALEDDSLTLTSTGVFYDVDRADDIFDTVEAPWIADAVSETPCGPERLLQLGGMFEVGDSTSGIVAVLPYFSDRIVLIGETKITSERGLIFVTRAALLTRAK
ncbi:hypothetical protein [Thalassorhabdomicrobium marinisediminis]|uniref:Uncharacterized protein n=1 Tax=Thalassorhabdomicrobium marinisediminis TaxID=2170577 RepID=A0A2T7FVD1_9RHOB|nr:hypothetical protein [Thalassorhabdomicrobium marinisediminis]PVA06125.1 hypothetical protein DC363_12510 [Thalassorhabdomicrobium marinisediminis]